MRLPFPILCASVVHLDPEALQSRDKDFNESGQPLTTVEILIQSDVASPKMKRSKRNPAEKQIAKSKNNKPVKNVLVQCGKVANTVLQRNLLARHFKKFSHNTYLKMIYVKENNLKKI